MSTSVIVVLIQLISMVECPHISRILLFPLLRLLEDPQFLLISPPNQRPCPAPSPFALCSPATAEVARTLRVLTDVSSSMDIGPSSARDSEGETPQSSPYGKGSTYLSGATATNNSRYRNGGSRTFAKPHWNVAVHHGCPPPPDAKRYSISHSLTVHDRLVPHPDETKLLYFSKESNLSSHSQFVNSEDRDGTPKEVMSKNESQRLDELKKAVAKVCSSSYSQVQPERRHERGPSNVRLDYHPAELQHSLDQGVHQLIRQVGRFWNLNILELPKQLGSHVLSAVGEAALNRVFSADTNSKYADFLVFSIQNMHTNTLQAYNN